MVRHHYEYYKFHANTVVEPVFWVVARHIGEGRLAPEGMDLLAAALIGVLFVGSRDNLRNYYERAQKVLGPTAEGIAAESVPSP